MLMLLTKNDTFTKRLAEYMYPILQANISYNWCLPGWKKLISANDLEITEF